MHHKCFDFEIRDVRLVCDRIGISTQHGINGRLQLGDYFHARTRGKIRRYRRDYATKNIAFVPAILSVTGNIHPEFLLLLWMMTDRQLSISMSLGMKMTSEVSVSSGVVLIIGMRLAYASVIHTHLLKHGKAHPISAASVCLRSAAIYLTRSAVDISHPRQQGTPRPDSSATSGPASVRSDITNGLGEGAVGGGGNPSVSPSMTTGAVPGSIDSASVPLSLGRGIYNQASYCSASSSLLAHHPSSCFDVDNEEADVRANVVVVDGHTVVCASAV